MTGLLESVARKLSLVWAHDRSVRSFSRLRRSPARLAFNATEKLGPDISELLSMHCSWCVLDCGEAQMVRPSFLAFFLTPASAAASTAGSSLRRAPRRGPSDADNSIPTAAGSAKPARDDRQSRILAESDGSHGGWSTIRSRSPEFVARV